MPSCRASSPSGSSTTLLAGRPARTAGRCRRIPFRRRPPRRHHQDAEGRGVGASGERQHLFEGRRQARAQRMRGDQQHGAAMAAEAIGHRSRQLRRWGAARAGTGDVGEQQHLGAGDRRGGGTEHEHRGAGRHAPVSARARPVLSGAGDPPPRLRAVVARAARAALTRVHDLVVGADAGAGAVAPVEAVAGPLPLVEHPFAHGVRQQVLHAELRAGVLRQQVLMRRDAVRHGVTSWPVRARRARSRGRP